MKRLKRLFHHIGRRGGSLLFFGLVMSLVGWSYVCTPLSPEAAVLFSPLTSIMPITHWGVLWLVTGGMMFTAAGWKKLEEGSFFGGVGLFLSWGISCIVAGAAFRYAALYLGFAAFLLLLAGWPEPARRDQDDNH